MEHRYRPKAVTVAAAALILLLLMLPNLIAIPASLTDRPYLSLPEAALSLDHYRRFLEEPGWRDSFLLSFATAAAATLLALPLGTALSIGARALPARSARLVRGTVMLPIIVPGIVSAIAVFRQWTLLGLYDTVAGVVLVQMLVALPFVVVVTTAGLAGFDMRLIQAARSMGAGTLRIAWCIIVPGIRRSIAVAAVLAFVAAWDESVITLFVTGRHVQILPRAIWDGLQYDIDPIVAVVATLMLAFTATGVALSFIAQARRGSRDR
jgi:putative spermidine/putrescine transport system permease protein